MTPQETQARRQARQRRAEGVTVDFDGTRLALARRLKRQSRTALARDVGVSPAAVTQYEKGQTRPASSVLAQMAINLGVSADFFRRGGSAPILPAANAHFRSLRATPAMARDQALAFAELSLEVLHLLEQHIDFPVVNLPDFDLPLELSHSDISRAAGACREHFNVTHGPIPHVVRSLEAHGVLVLHIPADLVDARVDAFSTNAAHRPIVLLSPLKSDKARSRFDTAHELGHLVMHHDAEPGLKTVENEAQSFAAEFLMPADEVVDQLPRRLDWDQLHSLKRYWGVSLKALVYRAKVLKTFNDATYRRANQQLASWGNPEPGPLGPRESATLLGKAAGLLATSGYEIRDLADAAHLDLDRVALVIQSASESRPTLTV